ncbi:retrotransposon protein, putative, ty1-copia subclass [Tanacetum coccineum]
MEVENKHGKTIKSLRSDRGGEYMSQEFLDHLKEHGIIAHRTPPYTPQNHGVSERRNRTSRHGDLGEPANYRAAIADPESKKWSLCDEVEMQSMKDKEELLCSFENVLRPDIALAHKHDKPIQQNPGEEHWTAVKNILKYLRNTKDMFLVYGENMERELRVSCYTDARISDGMQTT